MIRCVRELARWLWRRALFVIACLVRAVHRGRHLRGQQYVSQRLLRAR